jgi:hypothetical protein
MGKITPSGTRNTLAREYNPSLRRAATDITNQSVTASIFLFIIIGLGF